MSITNVTRSDDEVVTGTVQASNPKGIRLAGHETWLNYSRWAERFDPPSRGDHVTVALDRQGYIRSLSRTEQPSGVARDGHEPARDTVITRLAVLKAAAEFLAVRPEAKSADVLRVASTWESWALRRDDA